MPKLGQPSLDKIETLDPRWKPVLRDVIEIVDYTVVCGHRNQEKQTEAFEGGFSTKKWPRSRHNQVPSLAVDLAPWNKKAPHIRWDHKEEFILLAGVVIACAEVYNLKIRWGGDWDGDFNQHDQTFMDIGHYELFNKK
jgi:peptidoglycan L-alanyl-D-glutamate endopeptidase CwlK